MEKERDQIWDEITDSAKAKIDYAEFEAFFDGLGGDYLPGNVLFMIMAGYADGKTDQQLVDQLKREFLLIGCSASEDGICWLLKDKKTMLAKEIQALDMALTLIAQGFGKGAVLLQVRGML